MSPASTLLDRRRLLAFLAAVAVPLAPARAGTRRIVSVGGAITEILYRLGREGEVVGVDTTSQYPPAALTEKPSVGYARALGAEGVLSLRPTLVLAVESAGPPDVLRLVAEAGVRIVRVPDEPSAEGVARRIEAVAAAVEAGAEGAALRREVEAGFSALEAVRRTIARPARALFVLSLQNGRPLVGGRGTTADGMLRLAGAANAAGAVEGWKPLSDEGVVAAAPETVVMMSRGASSAGAHADSADELFALPAFAATPAAAARRLITMDALYLLGFGPRTPSAARDLMLALHPDLQARP